MFSAVFRTRALFLLLFAIISAGSTFAQTINVNAANVLNTFEGNPVGMNLNYCVDDDVYLDKPISLADGLNEMGIGMLRYPGGEKSDNYLWSIAPWDSADPHFAIPGKCNSPNGRFGDEEGIRALASTLDFDEFMAVCEATGAKPCIVVAGDTHYHQRCPDVPSRQELITNAVEWVRYANATNDYDIKYWIIGNESYHNVAYDDNTPSSTQYADDVVAFATAMKAVDPGISVVANGKAGEWANTVMNIAGNHIDGYATSYYPINNWGNGYDVYRNNNQDFTSGIRSIISSIGDRDIRVLATEFAPIDWSEQWPKENDLGHAIVNFQMFGDAMSYSKVVGACFWNTRWHTVDTQPRNLFNALDDKGEINANGQALAVWGNNILNKMVQSSNSGYVNSFTTVGSDGDKCNVFLINKDYSRHDVNVAISNYDGIGSGDLKVSLAKLSGDSLTDERPKITFPTNVPDVSGSTIPMSLDPLSITVLRLDNSPPVGLRNRSLSARLPTGLMDVSIHTGMLRVALGRAAQNAPRLEVINSMGQLVHSAIVRKQLSILDLSHVPAGVYLVSIGNQRSVIAKQ